MKVVVTNTMRGWSGETSYVAEIAIGLHDRGCQVAVATRIGSQVGDRCRQRGIEVVDLTLGRGPWSLLRDLGRMRKLLRRLQPDVLLSNASRDVWLAGLAAAWFAPATLRLRVRHNLKRIRGHLLNRYLYRRVLQAIIAPAAPVRDHLFAQPMVPRERVELIDYGVPLGRYRADAATRARHRPMLQALWPELVDPFLLLYASRLTERKHPELAIEAVVRLAADSGRPVVLAFAGDTDNPFARTCMALAKDQPRIRFLGFQSEIGPWLAAADAFVLPSPDEAFGMAVVEAMAAGAVPIVPRRAGFPHMVQDAGELFDWVDPVAGICACVRRLRDQPERLAALRSAAAVRAEAFDTARMIDQTLAFFRRLQQGGNGATV